VRKSSCGRLFGYVLRPGTVGFGGTVALVGYMQHDLVDVHLQAITLTRQRAYAPVQMGEHPPHSGGTTACWERLSRLREPAQQLGWVPEQSVRAFT
jgi:hypothetical protein